MSHNNPAYFLDAFVKDEVECRCLDLSDFGQPIANEENDVPLYDNYNRGLVACEQGLERNPLNLEGGSERPGMTGYIPSMEESVAMGGKPMGKDLIVMLDGPSEEMKRQSAKRRGLAR